MSSLNTIRGFESNRTLKNLETVNKPSATNPTSESQPENQPTKDTKQEEEKAQPPT
jgi:hypothetical protein